MKKRLLISTVPFMLLPALAVGIAVYCLSGLALIVALSAIALLTSGALFAFAWNLEAALRPFARLNDLLGRARRLGAAPGSRDGGDLVESANDVFVGLLKANAEMAGRVGRRSADLAASETQLHKTLSLLNSIIEHIPDMIFVKDAKALRFVLFNKAGEDLLGYTRDQLIGKNDYDFFPKTEADFFTGKDRQVLVRGQVVDIEEEPIHTKSGLRLLHTKKVPLLNRAGEPEFLLGISEDITARKESEKAIQEKGRELKQATEEKDQMELFAHIAAHDLREPIHKISSFGDLLADHVPVDSPAREYLKRMQSATERMGRLIDDLLRFSKVTKTDVKPEPVSVAAVVNDVLQDLELVVANSGATVRLGPLPVIETGRVQVQEVMRNLLGNALKFRKKDAAPEIDVLAVTNEDGSVSVSVKDNGIGFDQSYLERIFRPFERLHARKDYDGSGMGLAICEKIVQQIGGTITATGTPGQGSVFTVTFPVSMVKAPA